MSVLINLGLLYIAALIVVYLHEIGHGPTGGIRVIRYFPFPEMAAMASVFRLGGLLLNFLLLLIVYLYKPQLLLFQLVGLVSFIHFVLYTFFGSFNRELSESFIRKNPIVLKHYIFDDVPNKYAYIFIPISIITFMYFKSYYVPILIGIFS